MVHGTGGLEVSIHLHPHLRGLAVCSWHCYLVSCTLDQLHYVLHQGAKPQCHLVPLTLWSSPQRPRQPSSIHLTPIRSQGCTQWHPWWTTSLDEKPSTSARFISLPNQPKHRLSHH